MKAFNYSTITLTKEISDRLIHTALRSVSLVHYTFRNDNAFVIPQNRTNGIRHVACEFVCAESPNKPKQL